MGSGHAALGDKVAYRGRGLGVRGQGRCLEDGFCISSSSWCCCCCCCCHQDGLAERLGSGEIPTKIREAPFVQIPLGVTEDRLVGTVDIEASMKVRGGHCIVYAVLVCGLPGGGGALRRPRGGEGSLCLGCVGEYAV